MSINSRPTTRAKYHKRHRHFEKPTRTDQQVLTVKRHQCDFTLLITILLLCFIGIVMITSSSYYYAYNKFGDSLHFFKRQIMWLGLSTFVMIFFMNFKYDIFRKWSFLIYMFANFFLILVLLIGEEINGAKRWLGVGIIGFQPSEFTKVAITIFMSYFLSRNIDKIKKFSFLAKALMILGIPVMLIAIENFSTALVVMAIGFSLIFLAGVKLKHLIYIILPVFIFGAFFVLLPLLNDILNIEILSGLASEFSYRLDRIQIWFDPWKDPLNLGFQTIQSLYAVGSGGLFGVGLGQSMQKRGFIPEAHNDIIFSIVCEELGLFGAAIVLLLFLILIWRGIKIAMNARDTYGSLLAAGAVTQVAVQVIINVAVNTNTIPVTGMPLPFISYGGSSLIFLMTSMGILLNVSRYTKA